MKYELAWRMFYDFDDNETVKIEILNFTCSRLKALTFNNVELFRTKSKIKILR